MKIRWILILSLLFAGCKSDVTTDEGGSGNPNAPKEDPIINQTKTLLTDQLTDQVGSFLEQFESQVVQSSILNSLGMEDGAATAAVTRVATHLAAVSTVKNDF